MSLAADHLPPRPRIKRAPLSAWYVLRTQPQKEFAAEEIMRMLGLSAFVPKEPKYPRLRRGSRVRNKEAKPKLYPYFTGYLFAKFEGDIPWHRLAQLHIITGVVSFDGRPLRLDVEAVARVMTIQGQSIPYRNSPNPHRSFQAGDDVRVNGGPHDGKTVPLVEIDGDFAFFVEKHFGRDKKRRVPINLLEAA